MNYQETNLSTTAATMETQTQVNLSEVSQAQITPTVSSSSTQRSYATVTAIKTRSAKEDAIIIDSIDGLTNDDYVDGLEELTNVSHIRNISKISGKRTIVYLSSKDIVQKIKNKTIKVKDNILAIKPYVNSNKRVVISNVHPMIPDELIAELLKKHGINIVSQISSIRASFTKPGRSHILSLRRQFYIKEDDEKNLPETLHINFENTTYWTYLTTESTTCFICKQAGHIAKVCTQNNLTVSQAINNENIDTFTQIQNNTQYSSLQTENINTGIKRALSTTSSVSQLSSIQETNKFESTQESPKTSNTPMENFIKPKNSVKKEKKEIKKRKIEEEKSSDNKQNRKSILEASLLPAAEIFNSNEFPFEYSVFANFITENNADTDIVFKAKEIVDDVSIMVAIIDKAYLLVKSKSTRIKLTKIKNKLNNFKESESCISEVTETEDESENTPTDSSISSINIS